MSDDKTKDRARAGNIASLVGIISNILLALSKIAVGSIFGAVSVLADGFNNLTDCSNSIMSMVSFRLSAKPADKEHPYGHERIEYIFSMVVAFVIMLIAFELGKESVLKIINPAEMEFSLIAIAVLLMSIAVKGALWFYNRSVAKKINSDILRATAVDCLTDCISTSVVLISILIGKFTGVNIDGYAGVLVALFIAYSGIGVLSDTFSKLIGQAPDAEMIENIKKKIFSHPEVLGIHDLNVYSYGPNKYFASVHIELDASVDVLVSHELIDEIEREFVEELGILLIGHLDPIVVNDDEVNALREKVRALLHDIGEDFSMHDFRMVKGEKRTNVIFDVAIPYGTKLSTKEIKEKLEKEISEIDKKYCPVIIIEYQTV